MIYHTYAHTVPAAYSFLPEAMRSSEATAMLLAIGLQESKFSARRQLPKGPARGFWQFERGGGVYGVMNHRSTARHATRILDSLRYQKGMDDYKVHAALEHNDVLACCFARLLLWTIPSALPKRGDLDLSWGQYLAAWRPGKPHVATWPEHFDLAWSIVEGT